MLSTACSFDGSLSCVCGPRAVYSLLFARRIDRLGTTVVLPLECFSIYIYFYTRTDENQNKLRTTAPETQIVFVFFFFFVRRKFVFYLFGDNGFGLALTLFSRTTTTVTECNGKLFKTLRRPGSRETSVR